ncbi:acyl-CoA-binding protein [Dyella flava]|nr:acyl-CoA-binding protein [Dyella flava]
MLSGSASTIIPYQLPAMNDLQREFEQAVTDIKRLGERPDNDTLLRLYALYKQGIDGDVHGCDPGFFDFIGTAKKEAWTLLKGMSQDEAKRQYIALVRQLLI